MSAIQKLDTVKYSAKILTVEIHTIFQYIESNQLSICSGISYLVINYNIMACV